MSAAKKPMSASASASASAAIEVLVDQALDAWRRHDEILRFLLDKVPRNGMTARPQGSRGRDVAAQFFHVDRVRSGWLRFHETGERPQLGRYDKDDPPTKAELRASLRRSGTGVEAFLGRALRGEARVRMFGGNPLRWMGYLIAHESHHRGQILLALKQSGIRVPAEVSLQGVWGRWSTAR